VGEAALVGVRVGEAERVGDADLVGVRVGEAALVGVRVGEATVLSVYSTTSTGLSAEASLELNFRSSVLERLAGIIAREKTVPFLELTVLAFSITSIHALEEPPLIEAICVDGFKLAFVPL
jgi:hypothetical protein